MTIFIASSRAKKLKKLRNLATNIINEYGYCYFIRVAFYEFRRQKFKLFFPDQIYIFDRRKEVAFRYDYKIYLDSKENDFSNSKTINSRQESSENSYKSTTFQNLVTTYFFIS